MPPPSRVSARASGSFLTTTSTSIDGYRVVETFGVVRGITVRSRGILGMFGVALQRIAGGEISMLTEMCERARHDAFEIAIEHATELGANALIALRYDANEIMPGASEVLCYGTAVRLVPVG